MKSLLKKSLLASAAILLSVSVAQNVEAQTVTINATATVSNELTLTVNSPMNFGEFIAVGDNGNGNDARVTIAPDGTVTVTNDGGEAYTAIIDDSAASAAEIEIADGAPGATINVLIDNVINPANAPDEMTLDSFVTSLDGGATTNPRTIGNTFQITYGTPGPTTMSIGATLETQGDGALNDGAYTGSFDVTYNY